MLQGATGYKGERGDTGRSILVGERGTVGYLGQKGEPGDNGVSGRHLMAGVQGRTGIKGEKGSAAYTYGRTGPQVTLMLRSQPQEARKRQNRSHAILNQCVTSVL
jgi:hypothetical protein